MRSESVFSGSDTRHDTLKQLVPYYIGSDCNITDLYHARFWQQHRVLLYWLKA